ncbi:Map microtubule affinity-regulating kinase [Terramyces sp. JEL0728]|nr:Map microtubule affinity-regulating kinase [Terramyces sp. JEL0728]
MKLSNYEIGKSLGEGAYGKVAIKIMNIKELQITEEDKKKTQDKVDQILAVKARKKIYAEAIEQLNNNPDWKENDNANLAEFVQKAKESANKGLQFEKEPSVTDSLSGFQKEVLLLMRLNHPNIVKIYQVVESTKDIYIVMDYAPGGDLAKYVAQYGHLIETEARKIFRQIVSAMDFIHSSHVVHRDLKMENILLDQSGNALVSDFGLSRAYGESDYMKTFCGTPCYCAPEILAGKPYHGTQSDIWAMGVILYAMNAGNLPFVSDYESTLLQKLRDADYEIPKDFSWELVDLLRQILVADPESRLNMDRIRHNRWVNMGHGTNPLQIEPPSLNKDELAKLISSVIHENDITIYNIHSHQNQSMAKNIDKFERKQRLRSATVNVAELRRKKSINSQPNAANSNSQVQLKIDKSTPATSKASLTNSKQDIANPAANKNSTSSIARNISANEDSPHTNKFSGSLHPGGNHQGRHSLQAPNIRPRSNTENRLSQMISNEESEKMSRESSVVSRMSQVSITQFPDNDLKFKEISDWHLVHKPPQEIRTMKFRFRKGLWSAQDPPTMFQDLHRALVELGTKNIKISKPDNFYMFHIEGESFTLDVELCKIWLLKLHGLKITKTGKAETFIQNLITNLNW